MKRILTLAMALSMAASQSFATSFDIKAIEEASAAVRTATTVVKALMPTPKEGKLAIAALDNVDAIAGEINHVLTSVKPGTQSSVMAVTRVIAKLSKDARWQDAKAIDAEFAKKFALELTHGVSSEVATFFAHKGITLGMSKVTENVVANRVAHALGHATTIALIETTFAKIKNLANVDGAGEVAIAEHLVEKFVATIIEEAVYNLMGHLVNAHLTNSDACYAQAVNEAINFKK